MSTILIIGGYGNTGRYIAELLLQHTDAELILAGRNEEKARAAANRLRGQHGGSVEALRLDAGDEEQLRGLPAALVRHAALHFDQLKLANVSSYMGIRWGEIETSINTMEEFAEELNSFDARVFRGKKRRPRPGLLLSVSFLRARRIAASPAEARNPSPRKRGSPGRRERSEPMRIPVYRICHIAEAWGIPAVNTPRPQTRS